MVVPFGEFKSDDLHFLGGGDVPVFLHRVGPDEWVLIDAGIQARCKEVWSDLRRKVKKLSNIRYWFITHSHYDHCGLLPFLLPRLRKTKVIASKKTAMAWKEDKCIAVIERLNELLGIQEEVYSEFEYLPFSDINVHTVEDGDLFAVNSTCTVNVIATPGHCRDQVAFEFNSSGYLFVADALGELTKEGEWNPLIFDDAKDYLLTLLKLSSTKSKWIMTGHNYAVENKHQIEKIFTSTRNFVYEILDKNTVRDNSAYLAKSYSDLWFGESSSFMPDGLHLKSMHRLMDCIKKYKKIEYEELLGS